MASRIADSSTRGFRGGAAAHPKNRTPRLVTKQAMRFIRHQLYRGLRPACLTTSWQAASRFAPFSRRPCKPTPWPDAELASPLPGDEMIEYGLDGYLRVRDVGDGDLEMDAGLFVDLFEHAPEHDVRGL